MNDIMIYNATRGEVLAKIDTMMRWNNAEIINEPYGKARAEVAKKANAYLEYIASFLVDLPMPD